MKKLHALFAALFAATSLFANDIYEIRPCDKFGVSKYDYDFDMDNPAQSGQVLYFTLRLCSEENNNNTTLTESERSRFVVQYNGTTWETVDAALNPLQIGIIVSGSECRWARLIDWHPTVSRTTGKSTYNLTDLVFEYDVQPGDLALPIKLASSNGKAIGEKDATSAYMLSSNYDTRWKIVYHYQKEATAPRDAVLAFKPSSEYSPKKTWLGDLPDKDYNNPMTANTSLDQCKFWVRTVDFDGRRDTESWEQPEYWKSVAEGIPQTEYILSEQGVPVTNLTELWVWAVDPDWYADLTNDHPRTEWVEPSVTMAGSDVQTIKLTYYNSAGTTLTTPVKAYHVQIVGGSYQGPFTCQGVTGHSGTNALLVLSGQDDFRWSDGTSSFVKNSVLTVPVRCTEPPAPSLTITRVNSLETTVTVTTNYTEAISQLSVNLIGRTFTNDMTVLVAPVLTADEAGAKYRTNDYVRINNATTPITEDDKQAWEYEKILPLTLKKGTREAKINVFGMGAISGVTDGTKNNVEFRIVGVEEKEARDFLTGGYDSKTSLRFKPNTPVMSEPAAGAAYSATRGTARDLDFISIGDNWCNLNNTSTCYQVWIATKRPSASWGSTWTCLGSNYVVDVEDRYCLFEKGANGKPDYAKPPKFTFTSTGTNNVSIKVVAPNGETCPVRNLLKPAYGRIFNVVVHDPESVNAYFYSDEAMTTQCYEFNEGSASYGYVKVVLDAEEPYGSDLWAFLALKDKENFGRVTGSCLTNSVNAKGIPFDGLETSKMRKDRFKLTFADGYAGDGTTLDFDIVLCASETYDADKIVTQYATGKDTQPVYLYNLEPTVQGFKMAGVSLKAVPDYTTTSKGTSRKFTFSIDDPSQVDRKATNLEDRVGVKDHALRMKYSIYEKCNDDFSGGEPVTIGGENEFFIDGPSLYNYKTNFTHKFDNVGNARIDVSLMDKDMYDYDSGVWTEAVSYNIRVTDKPTVWVEGAGGEDPYTFSEADPDTKKGGLPLYVRLSETTSKDLTVKLTVTPPDGDDKGSFLVLGGNATASKTEANVYTVSVSPLQDNVKILVTSADGTAKSDSAGFTIKAEVTGSETSYQSTERVFYVQNAAPIIQCTIPGGGSYEVDGVMNDMNTKTNAIAVGIGDASPISWNVHYDTTNDLAHGIIVTWSLPSGLTTVYTNTTTGTSTFTPTFDAAGFYAVSVVAQDKDSSTDNDKSVAKWWYEVKSSKVLTTRAHGPYDGSSDALSAHYSSASGIGVGRTYAGGSLSKVDRWCMTWNCSLNTEIDVYAWGYKAGEKDDGTLLPSGKDVEITSDGGKASAKGAAGVDYYVSKLEKDSFFYRWVPILVSEDAAEQTIFSTLTPARPEANADGSATVKLPSEKDDDGNYAKTTVEAIFSQEWLASDNIGDINQDGVPDVYVTHDKYLKGFGIVSTGGTLNDGADDLEDLSEFNGDADYLPTFDTANGATKAPGLSNTWVTAGRAFTAKLEIRGWGDCLNDAPATAGVINVKSDVIYGNPDPTADDYCPTSTLSQLEWLAFTNYCARKEFVLTVPAQKLEAQKSWSPERPTDPTKEDTDGDGMTDGYEYYIWYRAYVGYLDDDGKYQRLTGRRFRPEHPLEPEVISADALARTYDPLGKFDGNYQTLDTDNDGIPDSVEFMLGSCPFDFDSDKDGLPDGYELYISETDYLYTTTDGSANPDGDAMAYYKYTNFFVVPVEGGYVCSPKELKVEEIAPGTNRIAVAEGEVYTAWLYSATDYFSDGGYTYSNREYCCGHALYSPASYTNLVVLGDVASNATVAIMHFQVYQNFPFDPRTAWGYAPGFSQAVRTRAFTTRDEFLLLSFYYHVNGLSQDDISPSGQTTMATIWERYATDPLSADSDGDGIPDGVELYLQAGAKPQKPGSPTPQTDAAMVAMNGPGHYQTYLDSPYSPKCDFRTISDGSIRDNDLDGLDWPHEFSGIESSQWYIGRDCASITLYYPEWRNKKWPTNPWDNDTDGDGMSDGSEGGYFIYGSSGMGGGGLNPLSWDTDSDGLPDPWEAEFAGTWTTTTTAASTTTSVDADGTTNTTETAETSTTTWNDDGMDGTVSDAMKDWDHDGLVNWQEYMVGAMRCWRYDDTCSSWKAQDMTTGKLIEKMYGGDGKLNGEFWYNAIVDPSSEDYNPGLRNGHFSPGNYFSCANKDFDPVKGQLYMFADGIYHDLRGKKENRFTSHVTFEPSFQTKDSAGNAIYPTKYICCDPCQHDTDYDGMDDYYELFHGLNPLLGKSGVAYKGEKVPRDIVYEAYASLNDEAWNGGANGWYDPAVDHIGQTRMDKALRIEGGAAKSTYDFFQYPWLAGLAMADPDGDNIRNQQEAIMPNLQAAATYLHTDPTPLWMTDISDSDSLTYRYYQICNPDWASSVSLIQCTAEDTSFDYNGTTYYFSDYPWFVPQYDASGKLYAYNVNWESALNNWNVSSGDMYDYEENEGYDSDHDFLGDFEEAQGKTKNASDPQNHDDPLRRQAMWFDGDGSFLQTPKPQRDRVPYDEASAEPRQDYLYYTVECWAKPDKDTFDRTGLQTLVERAVYTGPANAADERYLRKNFLIGVNNGRWYTMFDSSGTDAKQYVEITDGPVASTNWTHVAATYDGTALKLYVDGICRVTKATQLKPENGASASAVDETGELDWTTKWNDEMVSILVGGSVTTSKGLTFDRQWENRQQDALGAMTYPSPATRADYGNFYCGHIDEVRVWDGARSAADISSDYENRVRYTAALAIENRAAVYAAWKQGARRTPSSSLTLPAELRHHWAFDHMAGAIDSRDMITEPAGFATADDVTDAMAIWCRPVDWVSTWLTVLDASIVSTTYRNHAWTPWISDTVGHLPWIDGTTEDSVYWSVDYSGYETAATNGYTSFAFPRTCETPSRRRQLRYGYDAGPFVNETRWNLVKDDDELRSLYRFAHRNRLIEGFDLMPFGGAFPKRISVAEGGMWDVKLGEVPSASDAWAQTGNDADHNGLPDWWEKYARDNYCKGLGTGQPLEWDTTVSYYGRTMPAWRAYLRDLADGLVKIGDYVGYPEDADGNRLYADTRDTDGDGMPDWWEEIWKLDATVDNADDDPDNDGLSNYQEYLLSEIYPDKKKGYNLAEEYGVSAVTLDPNLDHSAVDQQVSDYFLCYTNALTEVKSGNGQSHFFLNEYFGEIVTDHDFMEDWWENLYDQSYTSARKYDPADDKDDDGWTTWAECRASIWGGSFTASLIDKWTGTESDIPVQCRPQPIVGVKVTYYGKQDISGQQLVVRTSSGQRQRIDATFVVPSELDSQTKYIGGFQGDSILHGHMSPGLLNVNSIVFSCALVSSDKVYTWNCDWYKSNVPNEAGWDSVTWKSSSRTHTGSFDEYKEEHETWPHVELEGGDLTWEAFVQTVPSTDLSSGTLVINGVTNCGWVDCTTGEYELDLSKFSGEDTVDKYLFKVVYTSRLGHEWPQTVYLSDTKELEFEGVGGTGNGYIREGRNTIEAFMDLDGDGAYTVGEPFGSVRNVLVGWHKVPVVTIELKDTSPIMSGVAIAGGDESASSGDDSETEDETSAETAGTSSIQKTVRITRRLINGLNENEGKHLTERQLVTKTIVLDDHPYITEADVVNVAKPDLDWSWLTKDAKKFGIDNIETVKYSVDEVQTLADGSTTNITLSTFVKTFLTARTVASTVSPVANAPVYSASPALTFAASDDNATGYRLQIRDAATAKVVYDSGARILPGRTSDGAGQSVYVVTPPVFADMEVYAGEATGARFADGTNYQWRVALVNAKFNTVEETDYSAWADFQMDVRNENRYPKLPTGYGNAEIAVRYYGPTNLAPHDIIVEAFENADFKGQPIAQVRVSGDAALVSDVNDIDTANATLRGISSGKRFFRAYFDQNGNGIRDSWETWGYFNYVGKNVKAIYNPKEVEITASSATWQTTGKTANVIYLEDCDLNQNEYPDCIDAAGDWLAPANADTPYWEEPESSSAVASDPMTDTDGDGMPDIWENWNDGITDPLVADGDTLPEDAMDAMAYLSETWQMVTVADTNADPVVETRYLYDSVSNGALDPNDGLCASNYVFSTFYLYGPSTEGGQVYGVGTNVVITNDWPITAVGSVPVALVHAQVYARKGYNALTANAAALTAGNAVDTKPFTALDRYLTIRYFEAIGVTPAYPSKYKSFEEYAMNQGSDVWKNWTLMPGTVDANSDFVADGWQLYVMYGPNLKVGSKMATNDRGKTSPWGSTVATIGTTPGGEGLSWRQEYDGGNTPTDPWNTHTLKTEISDFDYYRYNIKTAETQLEDEDNDGLSNWAEYLAYKKTGKAFDVTKACSVVSNVYDYFVKAADGKYVGESLDADGYSLIADHDFMEDAWEDLWDEMDVFPYSKYANRYVYDANLDADEDGWTAWSECRAYHWGCGFYSDIIDTFITGNEDSQMKCLPQPAIGMHVTYNGRLDGSWKSLIVRTRTAKSNYPDAIFRINSMSADDGDDTADITESSGTGRQNTQILGVYNGMPVMRGFINPGQIVPSQAKFEMTSVSQEATYHWNCTECANEGEWADYTSTDTNGLRVAKRSGTYSEYKADITKHGDRDADNSNEGVHFLKTTVDWTTFATTGGGTDGRHGKIYLVEDDNIDEKTVEIGEVDYRTGEFSINLDILQKQYGFNFEGMAFQVVSIYNLGAYWPQTLWLSNAKKGYVKEGLNTIEAFLDLNEDGKYDIGEPYGRIDNVNVGWHKVPEFRLELRDGTYNGVPMFEIQSTDDQYDVEQSVGDNDGDDNGDDIDEGWVKQAKLHVDKAKVSVATDDSAASADGSYGVAEFTLDPDGDCKGVIRIVRMSVNGKALKLNRMVYAEEIDVTYGRPYTVADFIPEGQIDFDSRFLVSDAEAAGITAANIRTVEYAVYWGKDSTTPLYTFTRTFDTAAVAPTPSTGYENSYYKLLKAQPELTWIGHEGFGAFVVQVSERADFGTVLYAATNLLPHADTTGGYTFKPDLYVGEGLKDQTTYYWRVAELNAKFTEPKWSDVASFSTAINSKNADTGYGPLAAEVRYFGPSDVALKNVIVGVYEAGDFCCAPVARKRLTGDKAITTLTNETGRAFTKIAANVEFDGIAPGEYYVMAFADINGNGVRDAYETWGYACKITTEEKDLWTPVATTVVSTKAAVPQVLIVMEDTDVNQNMTADCLEDMTDWGKESIAISVEDTDGDGMPDDYEKQMGLNPYDPTDADYEIQNDVMAYEDVANVTLLQIGTSSADAAWYAVTDLEGEGVTLRDSVVARQTAAKDISSLVTTWQMGTRIGIGRHVTFAGNEKVLAAKTATVRLVHAQVYEKNGFNALTANVQAHADGTAVNTKPFTPLDKYLVCRYLENSGVGGITEAGMLAAVEAAAYAGNDTTAVWLRYALDPNATDRDSDGMPDGWELYVMFGPNGATSVTGLANAKISPWKDGDAIETSPGDAALAAGVRLTNYGEYGLYLGPCEKYYGTIHPTDPWTADTDGDNVIDFYYHKYRLWAAGKDFDGDGLSNYAEYLISEVFKFAQLDPDSKKTNGSCVDYFRKVGDLYLGEMFTDHDQVDDLWEQDNNDFANRYVYDPSRDDDGDGWCNYSEAKAGTHPGAVTAPGVDGNVSKEYPVPVIAAKVVYSGKQSLSGPLVFQAHSERIDPEMTGTPDAVWTVTDEDSATNVTKYVGQNPGKTVTYQLGPGVISPGSVKIHFLDAEFELANVIDGVEKYSYRGEVGNADWFNYVQDYSGELYTAAITNGVLSAASTQEKVGTVDYATGKVTIDFGSAALQQVIYQKTVDGTSDENDTGTNSQSLPYTHAKLDLSRSYVKLEWKPVKTTATGNATYYLADATGGKGYVREGLNKFVVFCDTDESGTYTPGEPFGFVRGVDVGWQGGAFEVELTETSPVFARIDLRLAAGGSSEGESSSAASDREVWQEDSSAVIDISDDDYADLREAVGIRVLGSSETDTWTDLSATRLVRVRVMRALVNGSAYLGYDEDGKGVMCKQVVLDKHLDLNTRSYLHEGDFLTGNAHDVDWSTIQDAVFNQQVNETEKSCVPKYIDVTNVTYVIVVGEGEIGSSNTVLKCAVNRRFDYAGSRMDASVAGTIRPVIDTTQPQNYVYGARPTFRWAMRNGKGTDFDSYTAFRLEIRSGSKVVWDSGMRDLPPREKDAAGKWYVWTLDEPIGATIPASGNYTWRVAMYNAKFQGGTFHDDAITEWSSDGAFVVDMNNQQEMNDHGYSSIATAVKYAGPSVVLTKGTVYVQAFETADFAGAPAGQSYVTDDVDETASAVANAVIKGLPQDGTYWLRAFIDMDGDGEKDDFESWGAASEPVTVSTATLAMPTAGIWIEDADTDGDWIPDAYEYAKCCNLTSMTGKIIGGDQIVFSGTVGSTGTAGVSTGLSGASLTIFQNKSFITTLLDVDDVVSIDAIRAAVEKKVNPTTVKITALTLAPDGSKVTLSVAAEVTDSIAGEMLGKLYNITSGDTAKVTVHVYTKTSLATATWTEVGPKDATGRYTGFAAEVGRDDVEIDVDLGDFVDMSSGFYKIEVVQ